MTFSIDKPASIQRSTSDGLAISTSAPQDPISKSFSQNQLPQLIRNTFAEELSKSTKKRPNPSDDELAPSSKPCISIPSDPLPPMYTLRAELIRNFMKIQFVDNMPPVSLEPLGQGTFSEVFSLKNEGLDAPAVRGIPNDQLVIKILHPHHCERLDIESTLSKSPIHSCVNMIQTAIEQHQKLFDIFKSREPKKIPLTYFYNPKQVLKCGYSLYEKVIPIEDVPSSAIWDSSLLFKNLSDPQKKTYNSMLELILIDKVQSTTVSLLGYFASKNPPGKERTFYKNIIKDHQLHLDLKWNNFGFRQNSPNDFQLVLIDDVNIPVEHGLSGVSISREALCAGPSGQPNHNIELAFLNNEIALLDDIPDINDRYYELLNNLIKFLHEVQDIYNRSLEVEASDRISTSNLSNELKDLLMQKKVILSLDT
jgi:hypothetical protein